VCGTNCRPPDSYPAGYSERDLSVLRKIRCPLRNNLLQGQRSPQAPLLVTQLVRFGSLKPWNNGRKAECHCGNDTLFSLSIYLFSLDDSIINYRSSAAFIPRATPHCESSLPVSNRLRALNKPSLGGRAIAGNLLTTGALSYLIPWQVERLTMAVGVKRKHSGIVLSHVCWMRRC
jgi:hypothetical protein